MAKTGKDFIFGEDFALYREKNWEIVYQGVEGAYSNIAAGEIFPNSSLRQVDTFREAVLQVLEKKADFSVLPIENSSAGIVGETYGLLLEYPIYIIQEHFLPISHCLLGTKEARLSDIQEVYSHPQALMQCQEYLASHGEWKQISLLNTAVSARKIQMEDNPHYAAIASELAAKLYGLKILEREIHLNALNTTRFVVLSREAFFCKNAGKLSLIIALNHKKGALYQALEIFAENGLNLLKIESRPIPEKPFAYRFYIDFEGNMGHKEVQRALGRLESETSFLKILGNY